MRVIQGLNNVNVLLLAYSAVVRAPEVIIRGQKCRHVPNMALLFEARLPVVTTFEARRMNMVYAKQEWLWYLRADPADDSIEKYASMWQKLKQEDGTYNSNYGQYIFGDGEHKRQSQFEYVAQTLMDDPQSRRAVISLLQPKHLYDGNSDVVCTYAIHFTIVPDETGGALDMTIMMRSNDVVFGLTNDAFCFSQVYEFMYQILRQKYTGLKYGTYTHFTNSMHVYERHYKMLRDIITDPSGNGSHRRTHVPKPTLQEVQDLIQSRGTEGKGEYCEWLRYIPEFESSEQ